MAPVADTLLIAAIVTGSAALVLVVAAILSGREGQQARYYAARREAGREAGRRLALGFGLGLMAVVFVGLSYAFPRPQALPPLPTPMPIPSTLPLATPTAAPTVRATSTVAPPPTRPPVAATPTAMITPSRTLAPPIASTPALTSTPTMTLPIVITETLLTLRAIAAGVSRDGQPLNVGTEFSRGVRSIAVFFDYGRVPSGVVLDHEWLNAGKTHFTATVPFTWTAVGTAGVGTPGVLTPSVLTPSVAPTMTVGTAHISWSPAGGMAPGLYEVHVGLNGDRQFVANFLVR